MTRDRLAMLSRTPYSGSGSGGGGDSSSEFYEMKDDVGGGINVRAMGTDMNAFWDEIQSIQDSIDTFRSNITKISKLHDQILSTPDVESSTSSTTPLSASLSSLQSETATLMTNLKDRIKRLEAQNLSFPPGAGDGEVRRGQTGNVRRKLLEGIEEYQKAEKDGRTKLRNKFERQYKIVKPEATQEEIKEALDSNTDGRIFEQALSSTRLSQSSSVLTSVQERHREIRQIERTIVELSELFGQVMEEVTRQDEVLGNVERDVEKAEGEVRVAAGYLGSGKKSAVNYRKGRWICLGISVLVVVVVAIVVAVVVVNNKKK